jgi:hypothetical protein
MEVKKEAEMSLIKTLISAGIPRSGLSLIDDH